MPSIRAFVVYVLISVFLMTEVFLQFLHEPKTSCFFFASKIKTEGMPEDEADPIILSLDINEEKVFPVTYKLILGPAMSSCSVRGYH